MSNYTKNNLRFLLTKYKNEITNDNVEISFDDEDDGLDWLQRDIISGEHARRMAEQEKKTEKPDYTTGLIDVKNIGKSKSGIDFSMFDADEEDIDAELDTSWIEELVKPEFKKKKFERYLKKSGLKQTTIKNHMRNLDKYEKLENANLSQDSIYNTISKSNLSKSQKLTITSTLSKYLKFIKQPNDKIVQLIIEINNDLKSGYVERNVATNYEYTKQDILKQMNKFFDEGKYKHYIISYLVYNYNVRNTDLNLLLCKDKPKNQERYNYLYYNDKELKKVLVDGRENIVERNDKIEKLIELELFLRKVKTGFNDLDTLIRPDAEMRIKREDVLQKIVNSNRLLSKAYATKVDSDDEQAEYDNFQQIKNLEKKLIELRKEEKALYPPSDEEELAKLEEKIRQYGIIVAQVERLVSNAKRNLKVDEFVEYPEDEEIEEKKDDDDIPEYIVNHYFTPIYFVRNNYKTRKTYGAKVFKILDKKFHIAFHTYRDIMRPGILEEEKLPEPTIDRNLERWAPYYLRPPSVSEIEDFYALQDKKREALNFDEETTSKDEIRKHTKFLREEYMYGGPDDRFTGFIDVFQDIFNYEEKRNKNPNAVIPYIRYKKWEIDFIGSPEYWERQLEIVTELMSTQEYKDWVLTKKEERNKKDVKKLQTIIRQKKSQIRRFERQYRTVFQYDKDYLIEQDEDKPHRITYVDRYDKFYFYGTHNFWSKYVSELTDVLNRLRKSLNKYNDLLREQSKKEIIFGTRNELKEINENERIDYTKEEIAESKRIGREISRLDELIVIYNEIIDDIKIKLITSRDKSSESLELYEEKLSESEKEKKNLLDLRDTIILNAKDRTSLNFIKKKEMTGGGRKTNLQRLLDAEDKELRAKYRDPRVIEQKKRESAQARKEQAEKEEQEKQAAKQKRKKELSEQRREAMLKRLAGYREKRSKMARERKTKEAKEKQQKKKKAKIAKDFNLGFKLWKHKKPVGVVLYPDSYLEQMKNETKIEKDSSAEDQRFNEFAQRFNDFAKVYPDEIKRRKQIIEKNTSVSREKTISFRKQKRKIDCINIFPEPFYNSTNIVKRYLPYNLKTSDIVKIILKEDNTLGDAADIGYKRGTSLRTLQSSYNINKTKD